MEPEEEPSGNSARAGFRLPAVAYEREPGAASSPLPRAYRRREPERTALHRVVRENLATLLDEARERSPDGTGYPPFVERELERYIISSRKSLTL
jgi:hypothetical protein